jgi:hypothetical protein
MRKVRYVATADKLVASAGVPWVKPRGLDHACPRVRYIDGELLKGPDGTLASRAAVK